MKKIVFFIVFIAHYAVAQCVAPLITDFECDPPSQALPATVVAITNNFSGGINTSPTIGQYTDDGTQGFDALVINYGAPIDLSTNNVLQFKIYTPTSIQVLAKIEGGMNPVEIYSDFSQVNTWEEFTFDFSASAGDGHTTLVLFFNPTVTTGTQNDLYYFDDLGWVSQNILDTPEFVKNSRLIAYSPSPDELVIQSDDGVDKISLFTLTGALAAVKSVSRQKETRLDVSDLTPGIYFAKVQMEGIEEKLKVLIQ
ncbi:T9SS type A sorting domain-containing protein [Aquimarina rubra]|uniref:T9SS type A sorting domain-containing protein n=1 Tax=Aquimarina rubra TaxID=1920033 RepID=A0ABW5LK85_9FLAO